MVAYSFKPYFSPQVSTLIKRQTVRAWRPRHARPGEPVQLFEAMRTRMCRKLVYPDPICLDVRPILIETSRHGITMIELTGRKLDKEDAEAFAVNDGFAPERINALAGMTGKTALENMSRFWVENHRRGLFSGVVIVWLGNEA